MRVRPLPGFAIVLCLASAFAFGDAATKKVLFVGNSFTFGAGSPAKYYRADAVTDLNGNGWGGVPAMVKVMTLQAGLDWDISHETIPGANLDQHLRQKSRLLDKPWDVVCLQGYSTLSREEPGNAGTIVEMTGRLAEMFASKNESVGLHLMATWSRADQVYREGSPWSGTDIGQMALDIRRGYDEAAAKHATLIDSVIPVGEAWNRAMAEGVADPNPYDGISFGQVSLWTHDYYHASIYGYYLEALVVFGELTGLDPRSFGGGERVAEEMGFSSEQAAKLQQVAAKELAEQDGRGELAEFEPVRDLGH